MHKVHAPIWQEQKVLGGSRELPEVQLSHLLASLHLGLGPAINLHILLVLPSYQSSILCLPSHSMAPAIPHSSSGAFCKSPTPPPIPPLSSLASAISPAYTVHFLLLKLSPHAFTLSPSCRTPSRDSAMYGINCLAFETLSPTCLLTTGLSSHSIGFWFWSSESSRF